MSAMQEEQKNYEPTRPQESASEASLLHNICAMSIDDKEDTHVENCNPRRTRKRKLVDSTGARDDSKTFVSFEEVEAQCPCCQETIVIEIDPFEF